MISLAEREDLRARVRDVLSSGAARAQVLDCSIDDALDIMLELDGVVTPQRSVAMRRELTLLSFSRAWPGATFFFRRN